MRDVAKLLGMVLIPRGVIEIVEGRFVEISLDRLFALVELTR